MLWDDPRVPVVGQMWALIVGIVTVPKIPTWFIHGK